MARPAVDVVVPFAGPPPEPEPLAALRLAEGDSVRVVDNNPGSPDGGIPTPGYARNRGAERGQADWLLFLDADVVPPPDLLDRYFDPPPGERTALLGGGIVDEEVPATGHPTARYAYIRGLMSQDDTFYYGRWGFPKTANALCRRAAFEEVGGF